MVIAREKVGDECNKIGVSFSAFRNENERCSKPVNSCINNQIDDMYREDMALIKEGR